MKKINLKEWHSKVCEAAGYICHRCHKDFSYPCYFNEKGRNLYVCGHHLLSQKSRPDLREDVSNGKCTCDHCHKLLHSGN